MKPAAFAYERPGTLDEAVRFLSTGTAVAKVLAGGQSLGPMLNLRLTQPDILVDVTGIPAMTEARDEGGAMVLGACTTHAAIEDGRVPDPTGGILRLVARGIAYRAVRNRGTMGGSLAHADPAADWPTVLCALGAQAIIAGPSGERTLPVADFLLGPFEAGLEANEILVGIRISKLSRHARWGYHKFCRKTGEFAHAMAAVLHEPEQSVCRAVVGATSSRPIVFDDVSLLVGEASRGETAGQSVDATAQAMIADANLAADPCENHLHAVVLARAVRKLHA